jgi:hypothetical protein
MLKSKSGTLLMAAGGGQEGKQVCKSLGRFVIIGPYMLY